MSQGPVQLVLAHLDFGGSAQLRNVVLGSAATRPASPANGAIFFNSATGRVEYFDGSAWQTLASEVFTEAAHDLHDHSAVASTIALNEIGEPTGSVSFGGQRLTNLATPSSSTDAATKGYIDGIASQIIAGGEAAGAVRDNRLTALETDVAALESDLATETARATAAESDLQDAIDAVAATVSALDGDYATDAEVSAAVAAEASARAAAVAAEAAARTAADANLASDISAEASARAAADQDLQDAIDAEEAARIAADSAETAARQAADADLADDLATETAAREAADSAEASTRAAADSALQSSINTTNANLSSLSSAVQGGFAQGSARMTAIEGVNTAQNGRLDSIEANFATKLELDQAIQGLDITESVKVAVATTATTSGLEVDGATLTSGDRVLVLGGDNAGVWTVASGAWTFVTGPDAGTFVFVEGGTFGSNGYVLNANSEWIQFSGAGQVVAGAGLAKAGNELSVTVGNGLKIEGDAVQLDGPVSIANGGTGADNADDARANLGATTKYTESIGDASATTFTLTHNLGTEDVTVQVRKVSTGAVVFAAVVIDGLNSVTVDFIAAPAADEYRVVIVG